MSSSSDEVLGAFLAIGVIVWWTVWLNVRIYRHNLWGAWSMDRWRRCDTCKGVLVRIDRTPKLKQHRLESHLGHHLHPARHVSGLEWFRIVVEGVL